MPVGQGKVVLSAPHPEHPLVGSPTYVSELLRALLKHLGMQVASSGVSSVPETTPQYLLSTDPAVVQAIIERLLSTYEGRVGQDLQDAGDTFYIRQSEQDQPSTAEARQIVPCNSTQLPRITFFTPHTFFQHLSTTSIGRSMLYGEVVTSTQSLLDRNPRLLSSLPTGLISVATRQISGRGRGGNAWLSPEGCLMFSLILCAPPSLGSKLVFVQYLIALAAVLGLDPERKLGLCIKWPNDIYADLGPAAGPKLRYQKLGGILVNNSFSKGSFTLVVGCGINLTNLRPTLSVNSLIERANWERGLYAAEEALAKVMNASEPMWNEFVAEGSFEPFLDRYLASWIHTCVRLHTLKLTVANIGVGWQRTNHYTGRDRTTGRDPGRFTRPRLLDHRLAGRQSTDDRVAARWQLLRHASKPHQKEVAATQHTSINALHK